jgi:nucleotide-binding universal stress UspA family protein
MKILIAVDGSKASELVVQEALWRTWPVGSVLYLMTVVDPFFFVKAPLLLEEAKESARRLLQSAAEAFEKKGWKTNVEVALGNPRRVISTYAEGCKADLILVGSKGLNALTRFAMGSTVQAVLRHAPCSVGIVRVPAQTKSPPLPKRILIATDGSEFSIAALRSIAERPWPEGTEAKVISVTETTITVAGYPYFTPNQLQELGATAKEDSLHATKAGAEILSRTGLKVSTDCVSADESPARTIVHEAEKWGADLIVVGSHGRRGFDRVVMGSVSEFVAMHAHCSVEIIRAPGLHK